MFMNENYIQKLIQLYSDLFPEMNLFDNSSKGKEVYKIVNYKIRTLEEKSFLYLSYSLLSGEYLREDLDSKLELLIDNISLFENSPYEEPMRVKLFNKFSALTLSIRKSASSYRSFIYLVKHRFENGREDYFLNLEKNIHDDGNRLFMYFYIFFLRIQSLNHNMVYTPDLTYEAISIYYELEGFKSCGTLQTEIERVFSLFQESLAFLIIKLVEDRDSLIRVDRKTKDIASLRALLNNGHCSSFYINYLRNSINCDYPRDYLTGLKLKVQNKTANYTDYMLLMAFYKQRKKVSKVDALYTSFVDKVNRDIEAEKYKLDVDKYSLQTLLNYMFNCKFSLWLSCGQNIDIQNIKKQISELKDLQNDTGILNFHPYYKAFKALNFIINQELKKENKDLDLVKDANCILKECLVNFYTNLEWCEKHKFYPFQLPIEESTIVSNENVIIFLPSSFSRPVDYSKYKEEYIDLRAEAKVIDVEISLAAHTVDIVSLKSEFANNQKTSMKLLAGFTGVITFLFSCINIFSDNSVNDISSAFDKIIILGVLILLFASTIYLLTIGKEKSFQQYINLPNIIALLLFFFSFWYLFEDFHFRKAIKKQNVKIEKVQTDTLQIKN